VKVLRVSDNDLSLNTGITLLSATILDSNLQSIPLSNFKIDYTKGILYSNARAEFNSTEDYTIYYVQYSVNDNGVIRTHLDLLNNETVFHAATLDDFEDDFLTLTPGSNAYLLEEVFNGFQIQLPTVGTYGYKQQLTTQLKVLEPYPSDWRVPWYLRITNGDFTTVVDGILSRYRIAEFLSQSFYPEFPYKHSIEYPSYLDKHLLKLNRKNIYFSEDNALFLQLQINDADGNGVAAYTNDSSLVNTLADNGQSFQMWTEDSRIGMRSIDQVNGFVLLEGLDLEEDYELKADYYYTETEYEYSLYNFNPFLNTNSALEKVIIFAIPEIGTLTREQTIYYLVLNATGKVIASNWDGFDNDTQTLVVSGDVLYYETQPDWDTATATIFKDTYSVEGTNVNNFLVLAEVSLGEALDPSQLAMLDTRVRGGGIQEARIEDALDKDPDVAYVWDLGHWDGIPYPSEGAFYLEVPVTLMEGAGGVWTSAQIHSILRNHIALGVYPIAKAYGIDILISGINPTLDGVELDWSSSGFNDEDVVYNLYTSVNQNTWSLANAVPIVYNSSGNNYTITGLQLGVEYYVAIIGGILDPDTSAFVPYAPLQAISDKAVGSAAIGAGIDPQIKIKTFAPHIIDTSDLVHSFIGP
jgi:hypothetical protein